MAYKRKTFQEKFDSKKEAEIKETDDGMMVIPPVKDYDDLMKKVPEGKLTTQAEIRDYLANKYKVDFCCPLVTGIFTNIVAGKAQEDVIERGMSLDQVTPYWRTLRKGGELNPKYPGGVEEQAAKLREEGHEIVLNRNRKPKAVAEYQESLHKFS